MRFALQSKKGEILFMFIPTNVNISNIKIGNSDHDGSVSFGSNIITNRNVSGKKNQGFGQQNADFCNLFSPIQSILDNDEIDALAQKLNP